MNARVRSILDDLVSRYPVLSVCADDVEKSYETIRDAYAAGGKLLVCGNGGSAADAEHIAGELMKGFLKRRPLPAPFMDGMEASFGERGRRIAGNLQVGLPTIALTSHIGLSTAFNNDVDPTLTFAQQVYGYGRPGDAFLGISTSGNSANVIAALMVARGLGIRTIGLTGESGGGMPELCDTCIRVPAGATFLIQELHLPVYHCLCAMLEEEFFES